MFRWSQLKPLYLVYILALIIICFQVNHNLLAQQEITSVYDDKNVEMILIPSGEVQVGSTLSVTIEYCNLIYELPIPAVCSQDILENMFFVHEMDAVTVTDFYMDKYEVSVANYLTCVDADVCDVFPVEHEYYGLIENPDLPTNLPVSGINYYDSAIYCAWREARLPTESEWEYAASSPENHPFPWGDQISDIPANYCDKSCPNTIGETSEDGFAALAPVNSFEDGKSWVEVFNLSGNVSEWTSTRLLTGEGLTSDIRIVKGGNYQSGIHELLTWMRIPTEASTARNIGFRCVRTTTP